MAETKSASIDLTDTQRKNFSVRLTLTDEQRQAVHAATGIAAEAIEIPVKATEGAVKLVVPFKDLVCW